jgi:hypothetical protein
MSATIDHLVYGCPELSVAVDEFAELTGVRAAAGGQHPGLGTHNALVSLGERTYLELIAADPAQPEPENHRPFGLNDLSTAGLRGWAVAAGDLDAAVRNARAAGYEYGEIVAGRRRTPDGGALAWRMTSHPDSRAVTVVPFLIDWMGGPHPAPVAPAGLSLAEISLYTPEPSRLNERLCALGLDLPVFRADQPALRAVLACQDGRRVVLSS